MAKKSTKVEIINRHKAIQDLLLQGKTRSDIIRYCAETWQIGPDMADCYISSVSKEIQEAAKVDREQDVGIFMKRLFKLANDAELKDDQRTAASIIMNMAKLKGLDQTTVHHTVETRELKDLSEEDLAKIVEEQ